MALHHTGYTISTMIPKNALREMGVSWRQLWVNGGDYLVVNLRLASDTSQVQLFGGGRDAEDSVLNQEQE